VVDLTGDADAGLRQLAGQIQAAARGDFSVLNGPQFESLVADLLRATGFLVDQVGGGMADSGVDMRATYRRNDPFGSPEMEVWLVQAKLYRRGHVSVATIRDLAGILAAAPGETRGLLVTSAQVTSVATTYAAELQRDSRVRLRVLDGLEIRRMLRQFPAVAARHFGGANDQAETRRDADSRGGAAGPLLRRRCGPGWTQSPAASRGGRSSRTPRPAPCGTCSCRR
jgi:Restriction endonuclease